MKTQQVIIMERRQHPRQGVIAEIENLTYSLLRKHGIDDSTAQHSTSSVSEKVA